ncbi:MmcQ/YjbR family DNA-binding protein [Afipia sp. TerB]
MTFDDVEAVALQWPGVEVGTSYGTPALKVRKKLLARLKEGGETLVMPGVGFDERDMLIETQPKVFFFTYHYRDWPIVLIRLPRARKQTVEALLLRQWKALASKSMLKASGL